MCLEKFVESNFGAGKLLLMKNINRGGASNQKGSAYESNFAINQLCAEIAGNKCDIQQCYIAAQEPGFVDDLCVSYEDSKTKISFQAKNSSLAAADWTQEITDRFEIQYRIDIDHYNYKTSEQVLVVSCPKKAQANLAKIPAHIASHSKSEHFPYFEQSIELLSNHSPIRQNLQLITGSQKLDDLDYAFKLLSGAWAGGLVKQSVFQVLQTAKSMANPSIFKDSVVQRIDPPNWISDLIVSEPALQGLLVSVESTRLKVSLNGFEASASISLLTTPPEPAVLSSLTSPLELINFVFKMAQDELT